MNQDCLKCERDCKKCVDRTCYVCKHMKGKADKLFIDMALGNRQKGMGVLRPFDTYVCQCDKNILLRDNGEIHNFPIGASQWVRGINNGYEKWRHGRTCTGFEN